MHEHWHTRKGLAAWERIPAVTIETTDPNCDTPTGGCQEVGARHPVTPFLVVPSAGMRGNGQKLMHRKLHLNTRKNFFTVQVHGNRLPRGVVESLSRRYSRTVCTQSLAMCSGMNLLQQGNWRS